MEVRTSTKTPVVKPKDVPLDRLIIGLRHYNRTHTFTLLGEVRAQDVVARVEPDEWGKYPVPDYMWRTLRHPVEYDYPRSAWDTED